MSLQSGETQRPSATIEYPREAVIHIEGLTKSYDGNLAVNQLSLDLASGDILGLVGPNGAGKTTTLRCIAGIIPPTSGSVRICGHDINEAPVEARRHLAFVADEPHLFEYLTVWDHLMLFGRIYGVSDVRERAEELLLINDLQERRTAFPGELSRGMKQKLVIACALLHSPKVLILDEPLTGLDPGAMRRMKRTVVRTAAAGAAIIVSSHMLHLVEEICGRIFIIQNGRLALEGTLDEIRAAVPELGGDAGLEEIFLRATGQDDDGDA